MQLPIAPLRYGDNSPWHKMYAWLPQRVENKIVWFGHYYWRLTAVIDYDSYLSKTSECQWSYKNDQEFRLPENMTEEDLANAYD